MKFVHAADLHLDSPYKSILSLNEALGEALRRLGNLAFDNLIQYCIEKQLDFLLIAGDSFDSASGSLAAQHRFLKGMDQLDKNGIEVYLICGNHDPETQWSTSFQLPSNVHRFGSKSVERLDFKSGDLWRASIYGVSFDKREVYENWAKQFQREDKVPFAIGMLHGSLGGRTGHEPYCPFSLEDLRISGMDYWALGHIHKREVVLPSDPVAIYPGNLQGRHFNESGAKGCYLVEVDQNQVIKTQFQALSSVEFHRKVFDLTGVDSLGEFTEMLLGFRSQLLNENDSKSHLVKAELLGATPLFQELQKESQVRDLFDSLNAENDYDASFVFFDQPVNRTQAEINLEERKGSSDFVADLLQAFDHLKSDPSQFNEILEEINDEISGHKSYKYLREYKAEFEKEENQEEVIEFALQRCVEGLFVDQNAKQ